jgi:hypothetical protein
LVQGPWFVCALEPPGFALIYLYYQVVASPSEPKYTLPSIVLFYLATRYGELIGVMVLPSTHRLASHIDQKTMFLALIAMSSQISKPFLIPNVELMDV